MVPVLAGLMTAAAGIYYFGCKRLDDAMLKAIEVRK